MRILIITNYLPPFEIGGWEQLTQDVGQRLASRGHEVHFLTSNHRAAEQTAAEPDVSRLLHLESPNHVNYQPAEALHVRRREAENQKTVRRVAAAFNPDIIFINGMWNLPHSVARQAEVLYPGRVVYYMASYWPAELDAHTAYWTAVPAGALRGTVKKLMGQAARTWLIPGAPRNQLDFRLIMCVSQFMLEQMAARAGIPREQMCVVHNGIEPELFVPKADFAPEQTLRLLYAGRLNPDKGVHTIIEALHHLKQQGETAVHLSVFGGGAPDYEARLRQLIDTHQLHDLVSLRGTVPRSQMPAVFAGHDVLVFSSIWAEPLARIVQEAMACGLPVVGTTTGGTPEILSDGENGLTYDAGDAGMLAEKIKLLLQDRALGVQLAQAARQTVETHFTMQRMVDEIESHFMSIIAEAETAVPTR